MTVPILSRLPDRENWGFAQGDPVAKVFIAEGVDWSGSYVSQMRRFAGVSTENPVVAEFTVTAIYNTPDTTITLTLTEAESADIPASGYCFDVQGVGGSTIVSGTVQVIASVSVP